MRDDDQQPFGPNEDRAPRLELTGARMRLVDKNSTINDAGSLTGLFLPHCHYYRSTVFLDLVDQCL